MPQKVSNAEYSDMVLLYGFCNKNCNAAAVKYQQQYPHREVPCLQMIKEL
jgi:hypothetical protein